MLPVNNVYKLQIKEFRCYENPQYKRKNKLCDSAQLHYCNKYVVGPVNGMVLHYKGTVLIPEHTVQFKMCGCKIYMNAMTYSE